MKSETTNRATGILLLAFALFLSGCSKSAQKDAVGHSPLLIGAVAPTTGKYGEMGKDLLAGVRMAVKNRNAAGGIDGRPIKLVEEDDDANETQAITVAEKIVGNGAVLGVVGHLNSETTLTASYVYSRAGVALIMPVPTNPEITRKQLKNLFRVPVTDDIQGPECARFMTTALRMNKIAIIHNKRTYGLGIATAVKKDLESRGITAVAFQGFNPDDDDFRPFIGRIKQLAPDGVFLGGGHSEAALFIKQSREQGFDVPFVMGDGCFDSQLMGLAGAAAEGSFVSNIAPLSSPNAGAKAFYEDFLKENRKIVAFAPLGYVSATILLDAIQKAREKTRGGVLQVLQDPQYVYESILGKISFNSLGDSVGQRMYMHRIEKGQFRTFVW